MNTDSPIGLSVTVPERPISWLYDVATKEDASALVIMRTDHCGKRVLLGSLNGEAADFIFNALEALQRCAQPFQKKHLVKRELVGEASYRMRVAQLALRGES